MTLSSTRKHPRDRMLPACSTATGGFLRCAKIFAPTKHAGSVRSQTVLKYLIMSAALTLFCFLPVFAQKEDLTPPKAEIKLTVGAAGFGTDQGSIPHGL